MKHSLFKALLGTLLMAHLPAGALPEFAPLESVKVVRAALNAVRAATAPAAQATTTSTWTPGMACTASTILGCAGLIAYCVTTQKITPEDCDSPLTCIRDYADHLQKAITAFDSFRKGKIDDTKVLQSIQHEDAKIVIHPFNFENDAAIDAATAQLLHGDDYAARQLKAQRRTLTTYTNLLNYLFFLETEQSSIDVNQANIRTSILLYHYVRVIETLAKKLLHDYQELLQHTND